MSESPWINRLNSAAAINGSWLMVGLDPVVAQLPEGISRDARGVVEFNRQIIEATSDLVMGYKPNAAFYEVLGAAGWEGLQRTREFIPRPLFALLDAKRGDIGSTSEMYAEAAFETHDFDAVTVQPYVGREGVEPFLTRPDRGAFVLCRTSNRDPSFQDLRVEPGSTPLYETVATTASAWGVNVGLVIGATDTEALARVRGLCPTVPFLVPGSGTQGGSLWDAFAAGMDATHGGAILSLSRSVIFASSGRDFASAARARVQAALAELRG
jgi:orotidine-5'-phosphate decarboxylase